MSLWNFDARKSFALLAGLTLLGSGSAYAGAFDDYAGTWSGNGSITIADSGTERIRCRGVFTVDAAGNGLHQNIKCASDSYKFELASDVTYDNGSISGSWNESSRQVYGQLSGRATANNISAQASAVGVTAAISIATRGNSQSVVIRSPGSEISEIAVTMARAGR